MPSKLTHNEPWRPKMGAEQKKITCLYLSKKDYRLSGMVVDICRGLVLCLRLNPEAMQRGSSVIAGREHYLSSERKQKALLKFYKEAWLR